MKVIGKRVLQFTVSAAATTALAFFLVGVIGSPAVHTPVLAFFLNWFVMTWVVVIAAVWQLNLSLVPSYYKIRSFEINGRLYEWLGVRLLKKLLRRGPLSALNPKVRLTGGRSALPELEQNMRDAETGHAFVFITMVVITIYPLLQGWWRAVGWWLMFNVLLNVYPIMLQRYNRSRLGLLAERLERPKPIEDAEQDCAAQTPNSLVDRGTKPDDDE